MDYSDIINLKHPEPIGHPRMSMQARAAQFAPFAALTGHSAAIAETARQTEAEVDLNEDNLVQINRKMQELLAHLEERPEVSFTYFEPDARKAGGCYRHVTGIIQKVDDYTRTLTLQDGTLIELNRIVDINKTNIQS